jgi:hypothetical protein
MVQYLGRQECSQQVEADDKEDEAIQVLDGKSCLETQLLQSALACQELQGNPSGMSAVLSAECVRC